MKEATARPTRRNLLSAVSRPPEASPTMTRGASEFPDPRQPSPRPPLMRMFPSSLCSDGWEGTWVQKAGIKPRILKHE